MYASIRPHASLINAYSLPLLITTTLHPPGPSRIFLTVQPDHPSFEQLLSDEWSDIVTEDRKHGILLRSGLVPLVVEASSALLKALEAEQASIAAASADPSARPRKPIEPIEFIASYLMRNNPKYKCVEFTSLAHLAHSRSLYCDDLSTRQNFPRIPHCFIFVSNHSCRTKALLSPYRAAAMSPTSKCQTPRSARQ